MFRTGRLVWGPEIQLPLFLNHLVEPGTVTFGLILVGLLAGIPLLAMIYIGTKLVFRYKSNNTAVGLSMVGVWLVALVALIIVSASQFGNYKSRSSISSSSTMSCDSCQTLYLKLAEDKYEEYANFDFDMEGFKVASINGDEVLLGQPRLDVENSSTENFVITVKKSSRGSSREAAKEYTERLFTITVE